MERTSAYLNRGLFQREGLPSASKSVCEASCRLIRTCKDPTVFRALWGPYRLGVHELGIGRDAMANLGPREERSGRQYARFHSRRLRDHSASQRDGFESNRV